MPKLSDNMSAETAIPNNGLFVGRVWDPGEDGPSIVRRDGEKLIDITAIFPTMRDLCETYDPANAATEADGEFLCNLGDALANTPPESRKLIFSSVIASKLEKFTLAASSLI